jgi:peroxiredoxin
MRLRVSLLIGYVCAACSAPAPAGGAKSAAPAPLPDATLQSLDGTPTPLASFLHGRAALVSFWATWCDACYAEMDSLNRLSAKAGSLSDAVVLGVAIGEDHEKVRAFAEARGLTYPLLVDPDFALADSLGERRVPATLVVDHDGRIAFRGGALDAASLSAFRKAVEGTH